QEVRFGAVRANGEGAIGVLRDAALRDVGRLAVPERADPEIKGGARLRRSQGHAYAASDVGRPRQVVAQGRRNAAIARSVGLGVGREVGEAARPESVRLHPSREAQTSSYRSPLKLCRTCPSPSPSSIYRAFPPLSNRVVSHVLREKV